MRSRAKDVANCTHFDDPVAAYDELAGHYAELAGRRAAYLRAVEDLIRARIPSGSASLVDIGGGNGERAFRIAEIAGIQRVVLLEPSSGMVKQTRGAVEVWSIRAEDLQPERTTERFDVITCLWNVLGHIRTRSERERSLTAIAGLLSPRGLFFLDVNHRYNTRSYGLISTGARWVHDQLIPRDTNGDAVARWNSGSSAISTYGHVFTDREVRRMATAARLETVERLVVDYDTGQLRRVSFSGNLLYVFRRSSPMDSSSAPQTS